MRRYAEQYRQPPTGREVAGTPELLEKAAEYIVEISFSTLKLKERFLDGMNVHRQGDDESDGIECPFCGYEVARNDDFDEFKPKHCPDCGTKLRFGEGKQMEIKKKDMSTTEIRKINYENCPHKCSDCSEACESVTVRDCSEHLSKISD